MYAVIGKFELKITDEKFNDHSLLIQASLAIGPHALDLPTFFH